MTIPLENLEIYRLAKMISNAAWEIYGTLPNEHKYKLGQQFLSAADSVGANICEGYGRYHHLDSAKFYYISRGSLYETKWWVSCLEERKLITSEKTAELMKAIKTLSIKLNNFITQVKKQANNQTTK
jgi:four helix bundle protein